MRFLIGIDDTDNLESRGTGHRARQLGDALAEAGVEPLGVTRHQLLVDPRIPYTSHNSSACIDVRAAADREAAVIELCRAFLIEHSAEGSDAGLCVAPADRVGDDIVAFGSRAKQDVLTAAAAHTLAAASRLHLEGLTGTRIGVIGALAAVGLRTGGNDGRFLWMPGLREISGVHTAARLRAELGLDAIETEDGRRAADTERVALGDWARPLLRRGRSVLLIEEAGREDYEWVVARRDRLKQLSN